MFQKFYPDAYYTSTYQIPFQQLYQEGFRGIIFDIDNTLVPHGKPVDDRSRELIGRLAVMGFHIVFLSNNKEPRVKPFADAVKQPYIFKAGKPGIKNYEAAMRKMKTTKATTLFVGDQLFTDVWGANNVGLRTFLVQPINKKEEIQIVLKRYLERIVLAAYRRKCRKEGKIFLHGLHGYME